MGSANKFWHYARQCRELAARTADEGHREFMLSMAETWTRLAKGNSSRRKPTMMTAAHTAYSGESLGGSQRASTCGIRPDHNMRKRREQSTHVP
jgi:hypothetical protein